MFEGSSCDVSKFHMNDTSEAKKTLIEKHSTENMKKRKRGKEN